MVAVLMATRLIDVPFTRGLDESVDESVAALPAMTELVNYRLTRAGRLEHRLGVQNVGLTNAILTGTGARIDQNKAQAVHQRFVVAGGHGYTDLGLGEWVCNGSVSRYVPWESYQGLGGSSVSYSSLSCASVGGFLVVVGRDSDAIPLVRIAIFDELTGAKVWSDFSGDPTGGAPNNYGRVVISGARAVVVSQNNDTGSINGSSMVLTVLPYGGFPAITAIATGATNSGFDAAPDSASRYIVSYYTGAAVRLMQCDSQAHTITNSVTLAVANVAYTACIKLGTFYYLAWMDTATNTIKCAVFDTNFAQVGTTQTVASSTGAYHPVLGDDGNGGALVGWTDLYSSGSYSAARTTFRSISSAAALGTTYGPYYGYYLASKPFSASTAFVEGIKQPSCWLANYNPTTTELDRSYFLVTLGASTDQGAVFEMAASPSAAGKLSDLLGPLFQASEVCASTAAGQFFWQTALAESFRGLGTSSTQARAQVYRFGDAATSIRARTRSIVACQGQFAVLGGAPRYFDGAWLNELGLPHGPTVINAAPAATGSMAPSKTYRYVFTVEYFDTRGQRVLSYVTSPISVTLGPGDAQVNFEILAPGVWAVANASGIVDPRKTVIRGYRTAGDVGTVYRFTPATGNPNGAPAGPGQANGRVQYQDTSSDSAIAGNEAIYVQVGNALSNYRSPPCRFGCEHEGRLVVAGCWNPSEARVSKLFFPGEAIQFTESAAFTITNPEPITGCASLDGSLVLFAERAIYVVSGDGPTDDGASSFGPPRRLPGRIGCIDWRSVVTLPDGVYFRSADGIYILPRGLASPSFVGGAIRESLRAYPETLAAATVTRAVNSGIDDCDSEQVVAWLVGNQEDPTAIAIFILSLATGAWSRVSVPSSLGNPQVVMGVWRDLTNGTDVLAFVRKSLDSNVTGSILVENPGAGHDQDIDGSYEPLLAGSWKTGKIFPFGFGGRGSIRSLRLVGECLSATVLTPTVYSDVAPGGDAMTTLSFSAGRFAVEVPLRRRDLAWVQVAVADPTTGSANRGAGIRFNGLALEVEMEPGLHRSTPTERST